MEKLKAQYRRERLEKGKQMIAGVAECKQVIADNIYQEVKHAMQEERMQLAGWCLIFFLIYSQQN